MNSLSRTLTILALADLAILNWAANSTNFTRIKRIVDDRIGTVFCHTPSFADIKTNTVIPVDQ